MDVGHEAIDVREEGLCVYENEIVLMFYYGGVLKIRKKKKIFTGD